MPNNFKENKLPLFGVCTFLFFMLFLTSVSAEQVLENQKQSVTKLSSSLSKLVEIRNNWSEQLKTGTSQLSDACSYLFENEPQNQSEFQLDDFISKENKYNLKTTQDYETQISAIISEQNKLQNEQCVSTFSIFGLNNNKKQICSSLETVSGLTQQFKGLLDQRHEALKSQLDSLRELNILSKASCLSESFQDQFYSQLVQYQNELSYNEEQVISEAIRLLERMTVKPE